MKEKSSGLRGALIGVVMIVAALLFVAGGSVSSTIGAAMILGWQGGGRPTPKPKPTPAKHTKRPTPRPRPAALGSNAKKNNNAAPKPTPVANPNFNVRPDFPANTSNNTDASTGIPERTAQPKPNPDADILLPECDGAIDLGERRLMRKIAFEQKGTLSEISGKRKVFVEKSGGSADDTITARLREYSGLEIVETAREAEFAVNYCEWYFQWEADDPVLRQPCHGEIALRGHGGALIITTRDPSQHVPRVIWQEDDTSAACKHLLTYDDPADRLAKRFISELKRVQGGEADILLPEDFIGKEKKYGHILRSPFPYWPEETKPRNTSGEFYEILGKRKVFVNVTDKAGAKITERLRKYGGLEIVKTAGEAEFAVHFYSLIVERGIENNIVGEMIITIRDPVQRVPRIIWQNIETRSDSFDELIKRFIRDLKKLRDSLPRPLR